LNGFWSKELILEAGLEHGNPLWMLAVMIFTAGLTAFYTFRMVWLVFYGQPRSELHAHDAGPAMKVALAPLAFGTLTSWLLAGSFSKLLSDSLPAHSIEAFSTGEMLLEVLTAPVTLVAVGVILLGLAAWQWRDRLAGAAQNHEGSGKPPLTLWFRAVNRGRN